ncbi:MAG TPA: M56 family metallopeptidase [Puia sp.]|nr:M56 family metallopeptidase [Puia sp.]
MNIILYVGKVILVSALLCGYYWFALRNKQFHSYNRMYLIATVVISLILPCIGISFPHHGAAPGAKILEVVSASRWQDAVLTMPVQNHLNNMFMWQDVLLASYMLISFILILMLAKTIYNFLQMEKKYNWEKIGDIKLFYTHEPQSPFSFFKTIFWNEELDLSSRAGIQILRHEIYHVRNKHSFDILFLEIIKCIFWFNPFFFLIKKEIRTIHEFLADEYAVSGSDKYSYAELLIWQTVHSNQIEIINPFFSNQMKRRITMLTQLKNKKYRYLSRVMAMPILLILCCAFGLKPDKAEKEKPLLNKDMIVAFGENDHPGIKTVTANIKSTKKNKAPVPGSFQKPVQYSQPLTQEFADERQREIAEVKKLALNGDQAAYEYKGRTYIFRNQEATSFFEKDGINFPVLIKDKLYFGASSINAAIVRKDIVDFYLIDDKKAKEQFNMEGVIVGIRCVSDIN